MLSANLSFVSKAEDGKTNYWSVETTGDWDGDMERGRSIADEVAGYLKDDGSPLIVFRMMQGIDHSRVDGKLCPIASGFIHEVGAMLART